MMRLHRKIKFQVYNFSQQPNTISSKDLDQQAGQNKKYTYIYIYSNKNKMDDNLFMFEIKKGIP